MEGVIGAIDGSVYKIALDFETAHGNTASQFLSQVMQYLQEQLGDPSAQQQDGRISLWDESDGNVVMQLAKVRTTYMISLYQTSLSARTLRPKL